MICIYDTIDTTIYFIKRNYFCVYRYRMKRENKFYNLLHFYFFYYNVYNVGIFVKIFFFDNSFRLSSSFVFCLRVKKKKIYTKKYISEKEVFNFLFSRYTIFIWCKHTFYWIFFSVCAIKMIKITDLTLKKSHLWLIIITFFIFEILNVLSDSSIDNNIKLLASNNLKLRCKNMIR